MYASCLLARFMHCATNKHYGTAKKALRHIQGTLDYGLEYKKGQGAVLFGFCDSNQSGSEDDMRSVFGYAFTFGSGVFSWSSIKKHCVVFSNAKVEYISTTEATTQATLMRFVLEDFGEIQTMVTPLNYDNTLAIVIANHIFHQKTKHINRRYHFIKDALKNIVIDLVSIQPKNR
ncbi:secreted RxLR effector protein 161-like [Malus domestica]|uniref:secreted RxLR effector protein 161-like n=1 Tax=Malus domestica TaxID=3750 RepID=UPI0039759FA4